MKSFDLLATVKVKLGDAFGSNVEMATLKHVPQQPPWGCQQLSPHKIVVSKNAFMNPCACIKSLFSHTLIK